MRIALERPDSGGWLALFVLLPADKEKRDWKWKLRWALQQLNNLEGIENDTVASHVAMWQAAASNGSVAAGAGAEAEPKGQAATASNLRWRVLKGDDTMY